MIHRHLDYTTDTPAEERGDAALDDLLERGDLADWQPLTRAVAEDPFGPLSQRLVHLCQAHPRYGTSALWLRWIAHRRALDGRPGQVPSLSLAALRKRQRLSQSELAARVGMSQSDLSKAERRDDWKLSTLTQIAAGLGLRATVTFEDSESGPVATLQVPGA